MQIAKWDHKKSEGIYKKSDEVLKYSSIKAISNEMVLWLNENNGKFPEPYTMAYAVSHCQVDAGADPWMFFIVDKGFLGKKNSKNGRNTYLNYFFPSQVIINAKILETPNKIMKDKPERKIVKKNGSISPQVTLKKVEVSNIFGADEACMSFPNRTKKTMERFYRIKVSYQIPRKIFGIEYLSKRVEWVEGLKAHMFQHEIQHSRGENMYYQNN